MVTIRPSRIEIPGSFIRHTDGTVSVGMLNYEGVSSTSGPIVSTDARYLIDDQSSGTGRLWCAHLHCLCNGSGGSQELCADRQQERRHERAGRDFARRQYDTGRFGGYGQYRHRDAASNEHDRIGLRLVGDACHPAKPIRQQSQRFAHQRRRQAGRCRHGEAIKQGIGAARPSSNWGCNRCRLPMQATTPSNSFSRTSDRAEPGFQGK